MVIKQSVYVLLGVSLLAAVATGGGAPPSDEPLAAVAPAAPVRVTAAVRVQPTLPPGVPDSWWEEVQRGILAEEGVDVQTASPLQPSSLAPTPVWTASGDENACLLGFSVAGAGDVNGDGYDDVIVGVQSHDAGVASSNRGRAYVYYGSATGTASVPSWTGSGDENGALYGTCVSTAGDVNCDGYSDILVGAYRHNAGTANDRGRVYLYLGGSGGPASTAAWVGSGSQDLARYGLTLGAAGDLNSDLYADVVIGAPLYDGTGGADCGAVYVYLGTDDGLELAPVRTYQGDQAGALLGAAVATAGDVDGDGYSDLLLGASRHDAGGTDRGRTYVYRGGSSGPLSSPVWSSSGDDNSANYGAAVSTAGDVNGDGYSDIVVGAYLHDAGVPGSDRGRAYLYLGSSGGPSATASWTGTGDEAGAQFGYSVALGGDVDGDGYADLAVGAPYHDAGGGAAADRGRAYLYTGGAGGLATAAAWSASGDENGAYFGWSLFTAGDMDGDGFSDLVVGAPYHDAGAGAAANRGRAYLYQGAADLPSTVASWTAGQDEAEAHFGLSVASAGDVNGDGYSDVIVGAPYLDHSLADEGDAFLFYGSATGLSTTPAWSNTRMLQGGALFGYSVASAGDVNGDGFGDVVIGAPGLGPADEGSAVLFLGSPSGLGDMWDWYATGEQEDSLFGAKVTAAGDVNGDCIGDVLVGARDYKSVTNVLTGKLYLYLGSTTGLGESPTWVMGGIYTPEGPGNTFDGAGDVDRDGYSDVIVGYPNLKVARLYKGSYAGLSTDYAWQVADYDLPTGCDFGAAVAGAGDVNGDGYSDFVVGAPHIENGGNVVGRAYLFKGRSGVHPGPADWMVEGTAAILHLGVSVNGAGDLNGDGYSDLAFGASSEWTNCYGHLRIYLGGATGPGAAPDWEVSGQQEDRFGFTAGGAGDVNGDGFADVVVGAPDFDGAGMLTGKAYCFLGNGGGGVALRPQQREVDDTPLAPLGRAVDGDFLHALLGRRPFGRGEVKLEWQTVPLATAFDPATASMARSWDWVDTGIAGTPLQEEEILGAPDGPHCWRARTLYGPYDSPFQRHGPWKTLFAQGRRQTALAKKPVCLPPLLPVDDTMTATKSGATYTLSFTDPNPAQNRTGWIIRAATEPNSSVWVTWGFNVQDGNPGTTPQIEWTGSTETQAGVCWYIRVAAYNADCPAEGPF